MEDTVRVAWFDRYIGKTVEFVCGEKVYDYVSKVIDVVGERILLETTSEN